jgi:hypothetical protein
MPQRASVFCNFYIRVDREALVSERALDVGSVAFKAMSTKNAFPYMRSCQECWLCDFNHFQKLVTFLVQFLVIFNVSRFEASKFDFVDPLPFSLQPGTQQFATMIAL